MKTPDEAKRGVECCSGVGHCFGECPYYDGKTNIECIRRKSVDALACIQQLEATNAELLTKVEQLTEKCHQLERERDAAVDDMRKAQGNICAVCKNYYRPDPAVRKYSCRLIGDFAKDGALTCGLFEWRGVKEE